jgi:hypothetical protein
MRRLLKLLEQRKCPHLWQTVGVVPVEKWQTCSFTNIFNRQKSEGAMRWVRVHLRCEHCGKKTLVQGMEKNIAGSIHTLDVDWAAAIDNKR